MDPPGQTRRVEQQRATGCDENCDGEHHGCGAAGTRPPLPRSRSVIRCVASALRVQASRAINDSPLRSTCGTRRSSAEISSYKSRIVFGNYLSTSRMLSDVVCAGACHNRESMSGGSTPNPIRMIQLLAELTLSDTAMTPHVSTHPRASPVFMCSSCMLVTVSMREGWGCSVLDSIGGHRQGRHSAGRLPGARRGPWRHCPGGRAIRRTSHESSAGKRHVQYRTDATFGRGR